MIISEKWLTKNKACSNGIEWFIAQQEKDGVNVVRKLMAEKRLDWANWLIVRIMSYRQYVAYAIYAAEQVIEIYEKQHPADTRPRTAIEAVKKYLENPSKKNRAAVKAAAKAAYAAYAADATIYYAAYAAAKAADAAIYYAAAYAADAVDAADYAADAAMKTKILEYGLGLLEVK